MTPFHSTSKADFCVMKIPCVWKIFSKPFSKSFQNQGALKTVLRPASQEFKVTTRYRTLTLRK